MNLKVLLNLQKKCRHMSGYTMKLIIGPGLRMLMNFILISNPNLPKLLTLLLMFNYVFRDCRAFNGVI